MGELIYSAITSLDGFVADEHGNFDWAVPDDEAHAFINDRQRAVGTYLYGRRMYEVMRAWEDAPTLTADSGVSGDFAEIWQMADKIVYSTSLTAPSTDRTRIERRFDPDQVRDLKASASRALAIAGPTLAAEAFRAGLVDGCHMYVAPAIVGGGTSAFPAEVRLDLELVDQRRLGGGMVYLEYRSRNG